tara:strand:- start:474 stop:857 length:384 start_codon:yes stop_codon:yes gene_type:complete
VQRKNQEVNWREYFGSIQNVCPHSLESFDSGRIKFVPFNLLFTECVWRTIVEDFDVVVFEAEEVELGLLKNIGNYIERKHKDLEMFYSYPNEGENSTPIPILLLQRKTILDKARKEYKEKINGSKEN